ncbi:MAG: FAD-dependent oxidoreductase, partial [Fimbriimonadaceae bacterium]|nr:FAD-dependent oxidoreductase [Fimbriimonadaceae bacterium]
KSRGLGGRAATQRIEGYTFDKGATLLSAEDSALERLLLDEVDPEEMIPLHRPIHLHDRGRIFAGDPERNARRRWAFRSGISVIGKVLARDLTVVRECRIGSVTRERGGWKVEEQRFDAVVLTPPAEQILELMPEAPQLRPLEQVRYRRSLSIMLGFERSFDSDWFALLDVKQDEPLTWLSAEHLKSPERAPAGCSAFVLQVSDAYARLRWEGEPQRIVDELLIDFKRLLGEDWPAPAVAQVHRWKFSQPETPVSFGALNPPGSTLVVAGDALLAPRLEAAYDTGIRAAEHLLT